MTDTWVPSPPQPPGPPPPDALPPANAWAPTTPCASADSPSIVPSVIITGVPAIIASAAAGKYVWSITLNDGGSPANFSIDHYDATGALIDHPIAISGTNGDVTLTHDPTQPLGVVTKQYADSVPPGEAPMDQQPYARDMGQWVPIPPIIPDAPNTSQRFGRFNSIWQLDAIQTDAPSDGGTYGRLNGAWNAALPLTGGTITGSLTVNQVLTVQGANSVALNAPGGNQRAILGQTSGLTRWQLQLGDITSEGLNNVGSNFALTAYSNTAGFLGNWLTIARADGNTAFAGPVTMNAGAAVNGMFALQGPSSFMLPGGLAGQALTTDGAGGLSWSAPPGGVTDAPNDGTAYARKSAAWAHLTSADITDWASQLANYYPTSNPSGYQTAAQVTAALAPYALTSSVPIGSSTPPLMDGTAAVGTGATWARADHVHPTDISRYAASNPSGYQTAAQVAASLGAYLPLAGGTLTGQLTAPAISAPQAIGDNRIINGDMRIDQRNGGASGTASAYTADRWEYGANQAGKGTWQRASSLANGFPYCLSFTSTTAYTSLASDAFALSQPIEADMVSDFAWGTPNAQPVTLSFWVNVSIAGTYSGCISNYTGGAATRAYPFAFAVPTGWSKVAIHIPGDTAGTWTMSGNGGALYLSFDLGSGANVRGPAGAWANGNWNGATGAVSVVATNGAVFQLTGVKLEIGGVATPYNRQSLAKSMADCRRYYQIGFWGMGGYGLTGASIFTDILFQPAMRATPTMTYTVPQLTNCATASPSPLDQYTYQPVITVQANGMYLAQGQFFASAEL